MNHAKRILTMLLVLLLTVTILPAAGHADGGCPKSKTGQHAWTGWTAQRSTCTEAGYRYRRCTACQAEERVPTSPALGHAWGNWEEHPATCTDNGYAVRTCARCGDTEWQTYLATGHYWDRGTVTREPSGFTPGEITYVCCHGCGAKKTEKLDPTETLFADLRNLNARSGDLRITEQPTDGAMNHPGVGTSTGMQYLLRVAAEGGHPPYTYQWYYLYSFSDLTPDSVVSSMVSSKVSGLAAAAGRIQDKTRPAVSKGRELWQAMAGIVNTKPIMGTVSFDRTEEASGGYAIEGATERYCEAKRIGKYYCVVTDDRGSKVTSRVASVIDGMYFIEQPKNASLYGKTGVELRCAMGGGSGEYEFVLLDLKYDGEDEGDDAGVVGRVTGQAASITVTKPSTYHYWVLDVSTLQVGISDSVEVSGDPLQEETVPPAPGSVTTGYSALDPDAEALTGDWYGSFAGLGMQLTLNEDLTYAILFPDQPDQAKTGVWTYADGAVFLDGGPEADFFLEEDGLRSKLLDAPLTREAAASYVPAEPLADAAPLEQYAGYWVARYADVNGVFCGVEALDIQMDVCIEGANAALGGEFFGDVIVETTFADGGLTLPDEDAQLRFRLQQDGWLRLTIATADGESLTAYLEQADGTAG